MGRCRLLWDLFQVKRNEHKTREQIQSLQDKRLRKLLYHAYDHSGYYRETFNQKGITREHIARLPLSAFPTMDKEILMEHFDEIVTALDIRQEELRKFDEETSAGEKLPQWIDSVREYKPDIIIGYPSAIKILGGLVESSEVSVDVCRVISCGEPLTPGLRNYLERIFGAVVVNFYGASESLALGVETDQTEGMYLFDDMNYIEVENGKMYLTSLYNYVQPLIRYEISDQLVFKQTEQSRYPFRRADILLSRSEDVLWFEVDRGKRDFLHPLAVEGICVEGLLDYQFRQTDKNAFEMLAQVLEDGKKMHIQEEIVKQMRKILYEKNMERVRFFVKFVEEILPDSRTGKKQLIVECND